MKAEPVRDVPSGPGDAELVAACARGEMDALSELYRRNAQAVFRFLSRLLADPEDAEDLLQATFVAAWKSSTRFRGAGQVRTWLFGIAARLVQRHRRSQARRAAAMRRLAAVASSSATSPDEDVAAAELLERLRTAVASMPVRLRIVYALCDLEGVPGTEAAGALELRPGTLWRRLHEARKHVARALEVEP